MELNKDFWVKETGKSFSTIFNANNAGKGHWGTGLDGKHTNYTLPSDADSKLTDIFSESNIKLITGQNDITVFQYIALVAILINETGGKLVSSITEFGSLEYMFNKNPSISKASYNASNTLGNKTAYDLFRDANFTSVTARTQMKQPKNPNDNAWKGTIYPSNESKGGYQPNNNYPVGVISECDFYKFRGRGLIQLTGRSNYKIWIDFIRKNKNTISGLNSEATNIINGWGNTDLDIVATKITNVELDILFKNTPLSMLTLKTHASNKVLKTMYDITDSDKYIELVNLYGKRISGGDSYALHYTNRVYEILKNIPNINV